VLTYTSADEVAVKTQAMPKSECTVVISGPSIGVAGIKTRRLELKTRNYISQPDLVDHSRLYQYQHFSQ
jgi:hypothetical protein